MSDESSIAIRSPRWLEGLASRVLFFLVVASYGTALLVWFALTSRAAVDPVSSRIAESMTPWFMVTGLVCALVLGFSCGAIFHGALRSEAMDGRLHVWRNACIVAAVSCLAWLAGLWIALYRAYPHGR